jgi:hypothetical protein
MRLHPVPRFWEWLLLGGIWLSACSGAHEPVQTPLAAAHAGVAPTANVPALVGLSIDNLQRRLGPTQPIPSAFATPAAILGADDSLTSQDSVASFKAGTLTLIACYSPRTRQVHDLLLLGHHEDSLMARAALRPNASKYLVLPVFGTNKPNYLVGLRVVATSLSK